MKNIPISETGGENPPIKVAQFGEGNFLRAFADYFIDILNEKTDFNGSVAVIKPIAKGRLERFRRQNNRYTVLLRGRRDGRVISSPRIIRCIARVIDEENYLENYLSLARVDSLRFVISNTTEAGIVPDPGDRFEGIPASFPGKLTKFLYERWRTCGGNPDKGLIMLPTELIDRNGDKLKSCVLELAERWQLGDAFIGWVKTSNTFCSTLVDRIVTGYPKSGDGKLFTELGYRDELLDIAEPFGLWVIEGGKSIAEELPFEKAGLPVVFTEDDRPYHERKVRVLNGAHTSSVLVSYLGGADIVRDMMRDEVFGEMTRRIVDEEIVPLVPLPQDEVKAFAQSVYERFDNPFIDHRILDISLNSVSKWKARVLPSFRDYVRENRSLPKFLTFSFAALLAFYRSTDLQPDGLHATRGDRTSYVVRDAEEVLRFFARAAECEIPDYVKAVAGNRNFWGEDMTLYAGFTDTVSDYTESILKDPRKAVLALLRTEPARSEV